MIAMEKHSRKLGRPRSFDRDEALQQAVLAFWRHGYETTSIGHLTKVMGVKAPSLYAAFGDKKRLFLEAMNRYAGTPDDFAATLRESPTAYKAVDHMLMSAADFFTNGSTPRGCLLASATASGSAEAMDVQKAVAQVRRRMMSRVRLRIEHDIAAGLLPADTNAKSLASLAIALVQGMSVLARDGCRREDLRAIVTVAMNAWPSCAA
jgi:AcrR family transcriptional regulator